MRSLRNRRDAALPPSGIVVITFSNASLPPLPVQIRCWVFVRYLTEMQLPLMTPVVWLILSPGGRPRAVASVKFPRNQQCGDE